MFEKKWALVTGASSGIGQELAREYAIRGANVVLVARRKDRLTALAQQLSKKYAVDVHIIIQDLSEIDAAKKIHAYTEQNKIHIDILANNAGYGFGDYFLNANWDKVAHFINVMITSMIELTHIYTPKMVERKFGRVLFISSMVTFMPGSAEMTLYNSAKTLMNKFSESLSSELSGTGVHATVVCPGFTHTEFQKVAGYEKKMNKSTPNFIWMQPDDVARIAINANEKNKILVSAGWINKCMRLLLKIAPKAIVPSLPK